MWSSAGAGRRRGAAAGLGLLTVAAGVGWRMLPLGLSPFWWKYGGSVLYVALFYWLGVLFWPRAGSGWVGLGAFLGAGVVEALKLVRGEGLDAFRLTLAGRLLLGRVFTVGALVAYGVGALVVCAIDGWWRGRE